MGPKLGYHSKDNGWMTFDHVRIPRNMMLQNFMSVDREGSVSINGDLRILYSTMLKVRVQLIIAAKQALSIPLLIGMRYSAVRRQFRNISG